ncbi:UPF0669 protein C6orf120 homolog isoform X1 [Prinia subflava]|uniref:UPF0669 protein C6orf120 homolog isoform X1 n=1 Tax=Prinia subflava TaxID=208062 RepID=UPI002FE1BF6C
MRQSNNLSLTQGGTPILQQTPYTQPQRSRRGAFPTPAFRGEERFPGSALPAPPSPGAPAARPPRALAIPGARPCPGRAGSARRYRRPSGAAPPAPSDCPQRLPRGPGPAGRSERLWGRAGGAASRPARRPLGAGLLSAAALPRGPPRGGAFRGAPAALRCRTSAECPLLFLAVAAASPEPEPRGRPECKLECLLLQVYMQICTFTFEVHMRG